MLTRNLRVFVVLAALLVASPVWGLSVSVVSLALGGSNSADTTSAKNSNTSTTQTTVAGGSVADAVGASESARVRYAANAWADTDYYFLLPDHVVDLTHSYDVTLRVEADAGTVYDIAIDSIFSGLLSHVDDDFYGEASAQVGQNFAVLMDVNGGGASSIPGLEGTAELISMGYYIDSQGFTHGGGHSLTGLTGTTDLTFNVSFTSQLRSWSDDVGMLLGMNQAPTTGAEDSPVASKYSGAGATAVALGRTQGNDGSFLGLTATVTEVNPIPEPSTALLLGLGLLGLGLRGRRTSA